MGLTACRSVPFCLLLYPSRRICQGALPRCHSEPVTVSLAWESVLSLVGKRIAAPVCTPRALASRRGLARNDKARRGGRPEPPSAREVAARSAGGGRDVTRFFLSPSRLRRQPPHRGGLAARRCPTNCGKKRKPLRAFFFCI